jgi:hypothetical protein
LDIRRHPGRPQWQHACSHATRRVTDCARHAPSCQPQPQRMRAGWR